MSVSIKTNDNDTTSATPKRDLMPALSRGWRGKCPNCGTGKIFRAYLKVSDTCSHCNEDLSHHRADDAPPYLTIVIVGHIIIGIMLHLEMAWHVPPMVYIYTLIPLAIILPLLLLPLIKGAIVALQWALFMHGFDPENQDD